MSRPIRIWFPGAWYHIFARGNNKAPIFFAVCDYLKYLDLLSEAVRQYGLRLHAYALMVNHIHLMVETGDRYSATKPMQSVHTAYTMYINRRYERVGHLFQGRYRSILVDQDAYALELSRDIHLNPVRSGLAAGSVARSRAEDPSPRWGRSASGLSTCCHPSSPCRDQPPSSCRYTLPSRPA